MHMLTCGRIPILRSNRCQLRQKVDTFSSLSSVSGSRYVAPACLHFRVLVLSFETPFGSVSRIFDSFSHVVNAAAPEKTLRKNYCF